MKNPAKPLLPKFILEKNGDYWQVWNTELHEVTKTFETKESGLRWIKDFSFKFYNYETYQKSVANFKGNL